MVAVPLSEERDKVRGGLSVHLGTEDGSKGLATGRPEGKDCRPRREP